MQNVYYKLFFPEVYGIVVLFYDCWRIFIIFLQVSILKEYCYKPVVRTVCGNSSGFEVKVGMHQGSALSSLLFVIVMEAISREFRVALPWELLYADDLVVITETEEYLIKRLNEWKNNVEKRDMRVNMNKTKVMISAERQKPVQKAARWPCGVCGRGVGNNSIQCNITFIGLWQPGGWISSTDTFIQ